MSAQHTLEQRCDFEMSQAQLDRLLDFMQPVPYLVIGGHPPPARQELANIAWARLGEEMGFEPMSVRPGRGDRFFSAIQKATRGAA